MILPTELEAIIAERDDWNDAHEASATLRYIRANGWRYISPRKLWDELGPAWEALHLAVANLGDWEAGEPERAAVRVDLAKRAYRKVPR